MVIETRLLDVLDEEALARRLTARKTMQILENGLVQKRKVTGFVITDSLGNIGIVDKSRVRWINKEHFITLMSSDFLEKQIAKVAADAEFIKSGQ